MVIPVADCTASRRRMVLWRHGRTEWNRVGRAQGHADVSLDDVGVAQAERAASQLATYRPAFVWSSDLARARETALRLVDLSGAPLRLDRRLREYDVGAREGMTWDELTTAFPEAAAASDDRTALERLPGAETTSQVVERMLAALRDAAGALGPGETGVLVGHGASLRTGLMAFFGVPEERIEMLAGMANGAWTVLHEHPVYGWQIVDYNASTLPEPVNLADDPGGR